MGQRGILGEVRLVSKFSCTRLDEFGGRRESSDLFQVIGLQATRQLLVLRQEETSNHWSRLAARYILVFKVRRFYVSLELAVDALIESEEITIDMVMVASQPRKYTLKVYLHPEQQ